MTVLINIDVPDLAPAIAFYRDAFGLTVGRWLGPEAIELLGWAAPVYLLQNPAGSVGAAGERRRYERHWTPVHLDVVVADLDAALARAITAGANVETGPRVAAWGKTVTLADPFGHGFCLIQFLGRDCDELAEASADSDEAARV